MYLKTCSYRCCRSGPLPLPTGLGWSQTDKLILLFFWLLVSNTGCLRENNPVIMKNNLIANTMAEGQQLDAAYKLNQEKRELAVSKYLWSSPG
jgi:hypothetical protein